MRHGGMATSGRLELLNSFTVRLVRAHHALEFFWPDASHVSLCTCTLLGVCEFALVAGLRSGLRQSYIANVSDWANVRMTIAATSQSVTTTTTTIRAKELGQDRPNPDRRTAAAPVTVLLVSFVMFITFS